MADRVWDLAVSPWGPCPAGKACRNSDAALVELTTASGELTIPLVSYYGEQSAGSILWTGSSEPVVRVHFESPFVGEYLGKTGRTTGGTGGQLLYGCQHTITSSSNPTWYLWCQDAVLAWFDRGDSGSPVYANPTYLSLEAYGIAWGFVQAPNGQRRFYFSKWWQIEQDLGYYFFPGYYR